MSYNSPPSATQKFLHGVNGQIAITPPGSSTSTLFTVTKADFTWTVDTEDVTNSAAPNWRSKQPSINEITGTITYIFDMLNSPFGPAYLAIPGNIVVLDLIADYQAGSELPVGSTFGTKVFKGQAVLKNFKPGGVGPQAGTWMVTSDFESTGTWTVPTT
jgi:hypothetical protein